MPNILNVDADAFSSGQISSKLWLCEMLESLDIKTPQKIWVYGGWYGCASLMLLSRGQLPIDHIRSFDIDPECETVADSLLENWVWKNWTFKALTVDCNLIEFNKECPDIIINCSTEHFTSKHWWYNIPKHVICVLQSNNMPHHDHHDCVSTLNEFSRKYRMSQPLYQGQLDFNYPNWQFSRFMIIGRK